MVRHYRRKTVDRWSKEDLVQALRLILSKKETIHGAARTFGISRATLYRYHQRVVMEGGGVVDLENLQFRTCGGNPILTRTEEDVLSKTVVELRTNGVPVCASDIKRICFEYCEANGIPNQFRVEHRKASDDWYYGFVKRHPECRLGGTKSVNVEEGTSVKSETEGGTNDTAATTADKLTPSSKGNVTDLIAGSSGAVKKQAGREARKPLKRLSKLAVQVISKSGDSDEEDNDGKGKSEEEQINEEIGGEEDMEGEEESKDGENDEEPDEPDGSETSSCDETEEPEDLDETVEMRTEGDSDVDTDGENVDSSDMED